ncbi:hypothetical protein [Exiguobacterium sp.]|uniref:hypothetical protein n=1 Tax=Exiguobacterium sp. TaxID=44751 RepID=UPI0028AC9F3E|nr:hypothetical protein [Exiguobacterium sp.]
MDGTARGKANAIKSPGFLKSAEEKAGSSFSIILLLLLLVGSFIIYFVIKKRKRLTRKHTLDITETMEDQSNLSFKNKTSSTTTQSMPTPPIESLRLMLFDFNQRLPRALKRRSHESLTDWTERIHLVTPLSPYFVTRYAASAEVEALVAHYLKTQISQ